MTSPTTPAQADVIEHPTDLMQHINPSLVRSWLIVSVAFVLSVLSYFLLTGQAGI